MNTKRITALLLVAVMCFGALVSCTPPPQNNTPGETEAGTTAPGDKTDEDKPEETKIPSNLNPSVSIIDVNDPTFRGFDDLVELLADGSTQDTAFRNEIENLISEGFISNKVNPNDDKKKFMPTTAITYIEAITLAVNAFAKDGKIDINSDNWHEAVVSTMKKGKVPTKLLQHITGKTGVTDRDQLFAELTSSRMNAKCSYRYLLLILVYAYETYTGVSLVNGKSIIDMDVLDLVNEGERIGMNANNLKNTGYTSVATRETVAHLIFNLKNTLPENYHGKTDAAN